MERREGDPVPLHTVKSTVVTFVNGERHFLVFEVPIYEDPVSFYPARFILDMVEANRSDKNSELTIDGFVYRGGKPAVLSPAHEQFMRQIKKTVFGEK